MHAMCSSVQHVFCVAYRAGSSKAHPACGRHDGSCAASCCCGGLVDCCRPLSAVCAACRLGAAGGGAHEESSSMVTADAVQAATHKQGHFTTSTNMGHCIVLGSQAGSMGCCWMIDSVQQLHRLQCAKPGCNSICCCSCCSDRVPTIDDRYADGRTTSNTISVTPVAVGSKGVRSCRHRPHPVQNSGPGVE